MDLQTTAPAVERTITLWQLLIPVLTPIVVAGFKIGIKRIPTYVIPYLSPLVGAIIDLLLHAFNLGDGYGGVGAFLGASGTGLREIFHHTKKRVRSKKTFNLNPS